MAKYPEMGELSIYAELEDKKNEFVRINMEIADIKTQIRNLQGQLKAKEEYASILMNNMMDICGKTGLTIYSERGDNNEQ